MSEESDDHCWHCDGLLPRTRQGTVYGDCPCRCHGACSCDEATASEYMTTEGRLRRWAYAAFHPRTIRIVFTIFGVGSVVACVVLLVLGSVLSYLHSSGASHSRGPQRV